MTPKLNFIGIIVSDMSRSLAFYRELGLPIPEGAEAEDHVQLTLNEHLTLAWDTEDVIRSFDPEWTRPKGSPIGLGFACKNPMEVNAVYARLTALGYWGVKEPWDAFWGQRYAQLADPDGTVLDLFATLEE